ncbi:MAG TPA: hypothetical protein VF618_26515 [Thermoanaerobaculia bacterium]
MSLHPELERAQEAIRLPEVQAMLRRLADFNLGIYMPHMHVAGTQEFLPLPDDMVQVESDLKVSFEPASADLGPAVEVAWRFSDDGDKTGGKCKMKCVRSPSPDDIHVREHSPRVD